VGRWEASLRNLADPAWKPGPVLVIAKAILPGIATIHDATYHVG